MNLTSKQILVLDFIKQFIAINGYAPTVREICKGLGLKSPATIQEHLKKLKLKGLLKINPNKSRTIELLVDNEYLKSNETCIKIPIYNEFPINFNNFKYMEIPKTLIKDLPPLDIFALKLDNIIYIVYKGILKNCNLDVIIDCNNLVLEKYSSTKSQNILGTIISKIENYLI